MTGAIVAGAFLVVLAVVLAIATTIEWGLEDEA